MIKKAIAYIEKFVNDIITEERSEAYLSDNEIGYIAGSKDVAESVSNGLEGTENIYSVYELNPYAKKGADKWEELGVTRDPEMCKQLAELLFIDHNGQIDLRYEYKDNSVYQLKLLGTEVRSYKVGSVEI